mgnify:CR=1 FL=1
MMELVAVVGELIRQRGTFVMHTGAGFSTAAAIPDFRGRDGIWTQQAKGRAVPMPRFENTKPTKAHLAAVALHDAGYLTHVVTQNVDGLHLMAGTDPDRIVEVHGTVRRSMCLGCGEQGDIEVVLERVRSGDEDPRCTRPACGGLLKRATVSFGQALFPGDMERADEAARRCDLLLAVGSTLGVYPVAAMVPVAVRHGAAVVVVNGSSTEMDHLADVVVRGSISEVLPTVLGLSDEV